MPGGRLYVCATPIGNLEDVTLRLLRVLGEADVVAAEDTRRTRKLLTAHGVRARLVSYHEANEVSRVAALVARMAGGDQVALVTDAGMPAVSDPGYHLVRACIDAGIAVEVVPGPSSVLTALVVSGLAPARFAFEGFLSRKPGERDRRLAELAVDDRTLVFFEAPGRVGETLGAMLSAFGDRQAAVARELTKVHEEVVRGPLSALAAQFGPGEAVKGEIVLVVAGRERVLGDLAAAVAAAAAQVRGGLGKSAAAAAAAAEFGVARRSVYEGLLDQG